MFDPSKFTVTKSRPIPVILLLDGSGSMNGEKIATLNKAVNEMIDSFKGESQKEVEIQVAVITFGGDVKLSLPLTPAVDISNPELQANGGTPMGAALAMAKAMIEDKETIPSKGYRPTVVLVSDGLPNDSWQGPMQEFIASGRSSKCDRMAMAIGNDGGEEVLKMFLKGTENQLFHAGDASSIPQFFRQVTMSVSMRSKSADPNKLLPFTSETAGTGGFDKKIAEITDF